MLKILSKWSDRPTTTQHSGMPSVTWHASPLNDKRNFFFKIDFKTFRHSSEITAHLKWLNENSDKFLYKYLRITSSGWTSKVTKIDKLCRSAAHNWNAFRTLEHFLFFFFRLQKKKMFQSQRLKFFFCPENGGGGDSRRRTFEKYIVQQEGVLLRVRIAAKSATRVPRCSGKKKKNL